MAAGGPREVIAHQHTFSIMIVASYRSCLGDNPTDMIKVSGCSIRLAAAVAHSYYLCTAQHLQQQLLVQPDVGGQAEAGRHQSGGVAARDNVALLHVPTEDQLAASLHDAHGQAGQEHGGRRGRTASCGGLDRPRHTLAQGWD